MAYSLIKIFLLSKRIWSKNFSPDSSCGNNEHLKSCLSSHHSTKENIFSLICVWKWEHTLHPLRQVNDQRKIQLRCLCWKFKRREKYFLRRRKNLSMRKNDFNLMFNVFLFRLLIRVSGFKNVFLWTLLACFFLFEGFGCREGFWSFMRFKEKMYKLCEVFRFSKKTFHCELLTSRQDLTVNSYKLSVTLLAVIQLSPTYCFLFTLHKSLVWNKL